MPFVVATVEQKRSREVEWSWCSTQLHSDDTGVEEPFTVLPACSVEFSFPLGFGVAVCLPGSWDVLN